MREERDSRITEAELASRAGTDVETVRALVRIGVIPEPEHDRYAASLVPRLRLALQLEATGISLEDVGRALRDGALSLAGADHLFGRPAGMLERSRRELLEGLTVSAAFARDVETSLGLLGTSEDEPIREDDAELLELLDRTVRLGIPEAALARYFQVNADAMRRVAQAGREMWETGVEAPLRAVGISAAELLEASAAPAEESQVVVYSAAEP